MTFAQKLFVFIDKSFDKGQNEKEMLMFRDTKFEIETDIAYGAGAMEKLDTYYVKKESDEKYPVFFYIHGGGFVAGDKKYRRGLARWAAKKGFFVVNANHALGPAELFPAGIQNLVDALNWVGKNAEKYNLDLNNMTVSGDSAGGYYAAMLACVAVNKSLQERFGVSTELKFNTAYLNCGIYDVTEALNRHMPFNFTDKVLHDFTGIHTKQLDSYEYKDVLAPLDYVDENFPKSFVVYADKDIFCKGQGPKLLEKLQKLGIYHEEHHSTKLLDNHCYPLNWDKGVAIECVKRLDAFLAKVVKGEFVE